MQAIEEIAGLVSSKFGMLKTLASMIKLEARLAGLSIFPTLLTLAVLIVFCLSFWVSSLVLFGYLTYQLYQSFLISIALVLLLNFVGLAITIRSLISNIRNMSFSRTRKILLEKKNKENHEFREKKNKKTIK